MSQDDIEINMPLNPIPGSAGDQKENDHNGTKQKKDKDKIGYYRKLAIGSIICGCSCLGYKALESSFQAEYEENEVEKRKYSQKAKTYGLVSIATLYGIILLVVALIFFVSYLLTLRD